MMKRPIHSTASLTVAGLMICGTLGWAETVLIETGPEGQNRDRYSEPTGTWQADVASSGAPGLTENASSRVLSAAEGALSGSARFETMLEEGGDYHIDLAATTSANARSITVLLVGTDGESTTKIDFVPGAAGKPGEWMRLGTVEVAAGGSASLTITADSSLGPVSDSEPLQLGIAAARFTNEELPAFPAMVASEAGAITDAIFSSPPQETVRNPFEETIAEAEENPFSEEPAMTSENPFAAPGEGSVTNPFDSDAAPAVENPFETDNSDMAVENPFSSDAAVSDNPFDSAAAPVVENPFEQSAPPAVENPFEGAAPREEASNPFGEAPPSGNPFAGAPDQTTSPFDQPAGTQTTTATSPFDSAPAQPASPFENAPAAGGTASPFDTAGSTVSPFDNAPAQTGGSTPLPFDTTSTSQDPFARGPQQPVATPEPLDPALAFTNAPAPTTATASGDVLAEMDKMTSVEQAREKAVAEKKPIFLYFGGESAQAERFERTLNNPAVAEKLGDFILMRVDYRDNRDLASKFAVTSFPYVVILNEMGYTVGHVLPVTNANNLVRSLEPFTLRY